MNKRTWLIILIVCVVVFFVSIALPASMGDAPAMIGGISMVLILFSLIGYLVASIRARHKFKMDPALSAALSAQTKPAPAPVHTPAPAPEPSTPAPKAKPSTTTERVHVRGVDKYASNVKAVAWENPDYDLTKKELIEQCPDEKVWQYTFDVKGELVPEPDNAYDPNAIMVQANGLCIGYVPKGSTAHIRKLMESGRIQSMRLDIGGGKYKAVYEVEDDKYEMDRDERPFSAVLELNLSEMEGDAK